MTTAMLSTGTAGAAFSPESLTEECSIRVVGERALVLLVDLSKRLTTRGSPSPVTMSHQQNVTATLPPATGAVDWFEAVKRAQVIAALTLARTAKEFESFAAATTLVEFDLPALIFLGKLEKWSRSGDEDQAVEAVIDQFESLLNDGDWSAVQKLLERCDVPALQPSVMLAILSMTFAVRQHPVIAATRRSFYRRVARLLREKQGTEMARRQLAGLE